MNFCRFFPLFVILVLVISNSPAFSETGAFRVSMVHPSTPTDPLQPFPNQNTDMTGYELKPTHRWTNDLNGDQEKWFIKQYLVNTQSELTIKDITSIDFEVPMLPPALPKMPNQFRIAINLKLSEQGTAKLKNLTEKHNGQCLAVLLGDEVIYAAWIRETVSNGIFLMVGRFTEQEAQYIKDIISQQMKQ